MRINLIDESFQNCLVDGRSEAMIIPAASFYQNREGMKDKKPKDIVGSTAWYFQDVLRVKDPDRFLQAVMNFSAKTGAAGSMSWQCKIDNPMGANQFFTYNTHQGPFERGMTYQYTDNPVACIQDHLERLTRDIFLHYNMPIEIGIGPLFWDPMYRLGDVTRELALRVMMAELNKYELNHVFNIYSTL